MPRDPLAWQPLLCHVPEGPFRTLSASLVLQGWVTLCQGAAPRWLLGVGPSWPPARGVLDAGAVAAMAQEAMSCSRMGSAVVTR
jgi:hypothetical protein